jgi:hypothetical protein
MPLDPLTALHRLETFEHDGSPVTQSFIDLPDKEAYYSQIADPISLTIINSKCADGVYKSLDDLEADISLLVSNTQVFFGEGTKEHRDAVRLWDSWTDIKESDAQSSASYQDDDDDAPNEADIVIPVPPAHRSLVITLPPPQNSEMLLSPYERRESSVGTISRRFGFFPNLSLSADGSQ